MAEINLRNIKVPNAASSIFKEECIYSFESPKSPAGLYVSLTSFAGVSFDNLQLHHARTQETTYLHIKRTEIPVENPVVPEEPAAKRPKPTVLAIGVEGGFDMDKKTVQLVEEYKIVVFPSFTEYAWPDNNLPEIVKQSVEGILAATDDSKKKDVAAWVADKALISKHADSLVQLNNGVRIPPKGYKCSQCDLTTNLWMNLTDGAILCGRKNWDGTGGNGHALRHFELTGFPLCVKLGTITPSGADVYSYAEDESVEDPKLKQHLAHFGINMMDMEKTEMTIAEMEVDINMSFEFNAIQEAGEQLTPLYGAGYTGLKNLGNSCYMNSLVQVLFALPEFARRYADRAEAIFRNAPANITADFNSQMAKLGAGLNSGKYAVDNGSGVQEGIPPRQFKAVVAKGHQQFSSTQQQDAHDYYTHLMQVIERADRAGNERESVANLFKFQIENRMEDPVSNTVRYTLEDANTLSLAVPMEACTNVAAANAWQARKQQLKDTKQAPGPSDVPVLAEVPFDALLAKFSAMEEVPGMYSPALDTAVTGHKTVRIASFPRYLFVHLLKFTTTADWRPSKLDVSIPMPDELNLDALRGTGIKPGETPMPERAAGGGGNAANAGPQFNQGTVDELMNAGFGANACKRAVVKTGNQGTEVAMNWLLEHMEDADLNDPLEAPAPAAGPKVDEESVGMLMSMGFSREKCVQALGATGGNMERATEWIFSHMDDPVETGDAGNAANPAPAPMDDGPARYRLKAIISHMGTSSLCGHYVCHIRRDGRWVIYNDSKVAASANPPLALGYLYLYERI